MALGLLSAYHEYRCLDCDLAIGRQPPDAVIPLHAMSYARELSFAAKSRRLGGFRSRLIYDPLKRLQTLHIPLVILLL